MPVSFRFFRQPDPDVRAQHGSTGLARRVPQAGPQSLQIPDEICRTEAERRTQALHNSRAQALQHNETIDYRHAQNMSRYEAEHKVHVDQSLGKVDASQAVLDHAMAEYKRLKQMHGGKVSSRFARACFKPNSFKINTEYKQAKLALKWAQTNHARNEADLDSTLVRGAYQPSKPEPVPVPSVRMYRASDMREILRNEAYTEYEALRQEAQRKQSVW